MYRRTTFLAVLVLCLGLTGAGLAQPLGLRGAKAADKAPRAEPPAPPAAPAFSPPPSLSLSPQAADQCRAACAQNYYFCLSGDSPEACPDAWSQCRLACQAPPRRPIAPIRP